jgi:hypothetical protein
MHINLVDDDDHCGPLLILSLRTAGNNQECFANGTYSQGWQNARNTMSQRTITLPQPVIAEQRREGGNYVS